MGSFQPGASVEVRSNEMNFDAKNWQAPRGSRSSWRGGVTVIACWQKHQSCKNRYVMWIYWYLLICWRSSLCEKWLNLLQTRISSVLWIILKQGIPTHLLSTGSFAWASFCATWSSLVKYRWGRNRWKINDLLRQWMHYAFPRHCDSPRDPGGILIFQFGSIFIHFYTYKFDKLYKLMSVEICAPLRWVLRSLPSCFGYNEPSKPDQVPSRSLPKVEEWTNMTSYHIG